MIIPVVPNSRRDVIASLMDTVLEVSKKNCPNVAKRLDGELLAEALKLAKSK